MYQLKNVVQNKDNDPVIKNLKSSPFWTNYTIKNKTYVIQTQFPQLKISDDVHVYEIENSRKSKYNLIVPYAEMLHPNFLKLFLRFQDNMWEKYNIWLYITDTVRSLEDQQSTNVSSLNVVRGNNFVLTTHGVGLQIDFVPVIKNLKTKQEEWINSKMRSHTQWLLVQEELNNVGLKWGGDFLTMYDPVHTQIPSGKALVDQILAKNTNLISKLRTEIDNINPDKPVQFKETNTKNRPINRNIYWL